MSKQIEFGKFYKILDAVKSGDKEKKEELDWLLAEYEHAKESAGPYDELGQIFCHIGVMELYEYTGTDNITYINGLENSVWNYLEVRMNITLPEYMVNSMLTHAEDHQLAKKISNKWDFETTEIENNLEGLAKYVTEGIVDLIT